MRGAGGLPDRILVFDGDCPLCQRFSRVASWRWLVGETGRAPLQAFAGDEAERLAAANIHNEMAVLDRARGEIRSGYDGLVGLLRGGRLPWLASLLSVAPVRWLLRYEYRLVAYNRRILAPPARQIVCACEPDLHRGYRLAFLVVALAWTLLIGTVGGVVFGREGALLGAGSWQAWVAAGSPWTGPLMLTGFLATAPAARRLGTTQRWDYLGHLAWTFAAMVLPLLAATCAAFLAVLGAAAGWLPVAWVLHAEVPLATGLVAWLLALPIAAASCRGRLPRLGWSRRAAALVALAAWLVPTAWMALLAYLHDSWPGSLP